MTDQTWTRAVALASELGDTVHHLRVQSSLANKENTHIHQLGL